MFTAAYTGPCLEPGKRLAHHRIQFHEYSLSPSFCPWVFHYACPSTISYVFPISKVRATCVASLILLDLTTAISDEEYKLFN